MVSLGLGARTSPGLQAGSIQKDPNQEHSDPYLFGALGLIGL